MMNENYEKEFNLNQEMIHVNHAAIAPWPVRTQQAVSDFASENTHQGSLNYMQWLEQESKLREQLRRLINADSTDEIALLKSTSEALSVVAYGIDWQAGDSIVTSAEEFPSNRLLWESLSKFGIEVRIVEYAADEDAELSLINATDKTTRLISVSAVQFASGRKMDLKRIGQHCEDNNILFCVDAIQQLGALSFDIKEIKADFVAADGHKWMLGAEGLALFYCNRKHLKSLKLNQYGWHMIENPHDFSSTEWLPANTARRFECGSPNMIGIMALQASLSLIFEIGINTIEEQILDNTEYLIEQLSKQADIQILSPQKVSQRSGIVVFKHAKIPVDELFEKLTSNNVFCAMRGGGIRLSPHFYTAREKLQQLIKLIK